MKSKEIARRYAEALYELVREEGAVDELEAAYGRVVEALNAVPDALRFLTHPLVPRMDKLSFLDKSFPDMPKYLHNLLHLLVKNGREGYINLIYDEFRALRGDRENIAQVEVVTAQSLSPEDRTKLTEHLTAALGKRVKIEERIEPELLGGARLEIDGKVIDGTLRAKLAQLQAVLAGE